MKNFLAGALFAFTLAALIVGLSPDSAKFTQAAILLVFSLVALLGVAITLKRPWLFGLPILATIVVTSFWLLYVLVGSKTLSLEFSLAVFELTSLLILTCWGICIGLVAPFVFKSDFDSPGKPTATETLGEKEQDQPVSP